MRAWLWLIRRYGFRVAWHFWRERMPPRHMVEKDIRAYADWYVRHYSKATNV